MSSATVSISITAKDGTKSTFDAIKRGATEDAAALQKMGAAGAASGQQVAAGAKTAESALKNQGAAMKSLAVGAGLLATSFTMAARASMDQTRQIDAINRLYGENADAILKSSEAIQDNTNFSNDAARQAAITGATLASNYQLTADQISVLIERSANLAQIHGIDLADSMTRVSGAIRGEGEAAELLGLNMSDSAVAVAAAAAGITNWTTGATEAEKAAFRYSLVLEQTNATLGAAQDAHNTAAGTVRGLANNVQDMAQSFASATGPVGESVAALSDYALQAGLAVGGISALAKGVSEFGAASKAAAAGGALLDVALGPVGLALAAGAAAAAIYHFWGEADASAAAVHAATEAVTSYEEALAGLAAQSNALSLTGAAWESQVEGIVKKITLMPGQVLAGTMEEIQQGYEASILVELQKVLAATGPGAQQARADMQALLDTFSAAPAITTDMLAGVTNISDNLAIYDQNAIAAAESTKAVALAQTGAADSFTAIGEAVKNLGTKYADTAVGQQMMADLALIQAEGTDAMKESLQRLYPAFEAGTDKTNAFTNTVKLNAAVLREQAAAADAAAKAMNDSFVRATDRQAAAQEQQTKNIQEAAEAHKVVGDTASEAAEGVGKLGHAFEMTDEQIAEATQATLEHAEANNRWGPQIKAASDALDHQKARLEEAAQAAKGYADALVGTSSLAANLRPMDISVKGGDKVTGTAADLQQTAGVLDNVLGTFKQLDSIGQAAEQAGSIAQNLIGDPGELGAIDSLLSKNRISTEQYNDAIEAGNTIRKEAGAIENDLNTIRAKQLPLLAEADQAYGNVIDKISRMGAEQAQATLGFMDSTEAMKAQNAVAVAAAAAQADVGSAARESAQAIIEGAVAADPVLESMLTSIGLVARDHEGNLVVNFDNADSLNESTDHLTSAIENLTRAIQGLPPIEVTENGAEETALKIWNVRDAQGNLIPSVNVETTESGADEATLKIWNVRDAQGNILPSVGTDIYANDNASGTINAVAGYLAGLNGMTATTYINTIVTTFTQQVALGGGQAAGPGGAHGLLVGPEKAMAGGGMTVRVNEGGQERVQLPTGDDVWLPQGSMVTPHAASKYGRGGGQSRGREFINYGSITILANNPAEFSTWADSYATAGR